MGGKPKITALVGCQIQGCAEDVSYPLHMVAKWDGLPICEDCYLELDALSKANDDGTVTDWADLPPVNLSDLSE